MKWITSSYSGYNGNCVQAAWEKSSYSGANNCVETAHGDCELVHVRDSKDPDGGMLSFSREDWTAFLATIKA